jgi:hypothetical protein
MPRRGRKIPAPRPKTLPREGSLGQRGINFIEKIVIEMGSRWTPSGANEAGIDGYIELFEPGSRRATGLHIAVQSKAVARFDGNTDEVTFSFKRDDIAYWLDTSPPVMVVVSCPDRSEGYWLSIPRYFSDPANVGTTTAHIDRRTQRFTTRSYDDLLDAARPGNRAVVRSPAPAADYIYSNLLPLRSYPRTIFVAPVTCNGYPDARAMLRESAVYAPHCWLLHEGNYLGFADPEDEPLRRVVDVGAIEAHEADGWANSDDPDRRRLFSWLLRGALQDDLGPRGIRFWNDDFVFAFKGSLDRAPRMLRFQNLHRESEITVVGRYQSTSKKTGIVYPYLRHHAFKGRFRRLDGTWYLEVTPTYRFTEDGKTKYRFHAQQLAGIKRYDGNRALLSQLIMWGQVLAPNTLFAERCLLGFGAIQVYHVSGSVPDEAWSARDPSAPTDEDSGAAGMPLFDAVSRGG